jgi:predicted methyltransferase
MLATATVAAAPDHGDHAAHAAIAKALADQRRSAANRARDVYRHPMETLAFFGVRPGQTLVEYNPGGGWYTEVLAPMLKGNGRYIALVSARSQERTAKLFADNKDWFGPAEVATLDSSAGTSTLKPNSVDVLLTFRNVHNMMMQGESAATGAFKAFHTALKPGGTLGIVDHRLPEARDTALERTSGYLKRSTVVRLAEAAGFKLAAESEINANPKDTADWPDGVWTLPPTLQKKDVDRAKYLAIGESDRMTLKFVKARCRRSAAAHRPRSAISCPASRSSTAGLRSAP